MSRSLLQRAKQLGVGLMVANASLRGVLNRYHLNLDDEGRQRFFGLYAKIFSRGPLRHLTSGLAGRWTVRFLGRDIAMPLNAANLWLDWDSAVAMTGHDNEVKQTYGELLSGEAPPELFFDVGANYGLHSILLRSAAVDVIAFEPNPTCIDYCRLVCELNGFSLPRWERVAIGDRRGQVDLVYPTHETWLGSISPAVAQTIAQTRETTRQVVPLRPLDDYMDQAAGKRLLIKIDVEGLELEVLRGASRILADVRPRIIFESNDPRSRSQLYDLLTSRDFGVYALPWRRSDGRSSPMTGETFQRSSATNFMAAPISAP